MDLETYLKENKITKTAFAKKIGIHRSYLSNYIHKKMAFGKFLSEKIVIETNGEVSYASLMQVLGSRMKKGSFLRNILGVNSWRPERRLSYGCAKKSKERIKKSQSIYQWMKCRST
jgi:hypothetical protein